MTAMLDGDQFLDEEIGDKGEQLVALVARCCLWANKEIVKAVDSDNAERGIKTTGGLWFPGTARGQATKTTKRKQFNEKAKIAIFSAAGLNDGYKSGTFHACHVWEKTAGKPNCYSALANLVILPRSLHGLSEHWPVAQKFLQWKSHQLFRWQPKSKGNNHTPPPGGSGVINFRSIDAKNPARSEERWTDEIGKRVERSVKKRQLKRKAKGGR
jgi:hypothetical protein